MMWNLRIFFHLLFTAALPQMCERRSHSFWCTNFRLNLPPSHLHNRRRSAFWFVLNRKWVEEVVWEKNCNTRWHARSGGGYLRRFWTISLLSRLPPQKPQTSSDFFFHCCRACLVFKESVSNVVSDYDAFRHVANNHNALNSRHSLDGRGRSYINFNFEM